MIRLESVKMFPIIVERKFMLWISCRCFRERSLVHATSSIPRASRENTVIQITDNGCLRQITGIPHLVRDNVYFQGAPTCKAEKGLGKKPKTNQPNKNESTDSNPDSKSFGPGWTRDGEKGRDKELIPIGQLRVLLKHHSKHLLSDICVLTTCSVPSITSQLSWSDSTVNLHYSFLQTNPDVSCHCLCLLILLKNNNCIWTGCPDPV